MSIVAGAWLYTPASRPELFDKAQRSGADVVIIDLEDAVRPADKDGARQQVRGYLEGSAERKVPVHLRINDLNSPWFSDDLALATDLATALAGVRIPKVESLTALDAVASAVPGVELFPLLESALGLKLMTEVAEHPQVRSVGLGDLDLRISIGLEAPSAFEMIRVMLVLALAAAGKDGVLGSVYPQVKDLDGLGAESQHLRALGMTGRTVIHPGQVSVVQKAFAPTSAEQQWAREVLETLGDESSLTNPGAFVMANGDFVDAPVIERARKILSAIQLSHSGGEHEGETS